VSYRWMTIAVLSLPTVFVSCQDAEQAPEPIDALHGPDGHADWAWTSIDEMQKAVDDSEALAQINAQEDLVAELSEGLLADWIDAWQAKDAAAFSGLLTSASADLAWDEGLSLIERRRGIAQLNWAPGSATGDTHLADYLAGIQQVIDMRLEPLSIALTDAGAQLQLRLDLRVVDADGQRRHDRGVLAVSVQQSGDKWLLSDIKAERLERLLASRPPAYVDASSAWGLDDIPVTDRREAIRRGGYALSVVDYDGDSRPDLLFGDYGPAQLMRNTGSGFETVDIGLGPEDSVKSSAIVDLDNDGDRDLLLLRFAYGDGPLGDMVAYRNDDGQFTRVARPLPRRRTYDRAMPLTLADFDRDGHLDVYIGFPGTMDFTNNLEAATRPDNLASQGIWFNEGDWRFKEAAVGHTITKSNQVYSHGAVASDIDQDGHVDIVVVDDSGRINPVYKNNGAGQFEEVSRASGLQAPGWSMGVSTGDFNGDGHLDILSTNIALSAGTRILQSAQGSTGIDKLDTLRMEYVGAQLYQSNGDGTYTEVADQAGLDWVGDAAAGAEFIDYDHDGLLDIYVSNGLWTGGERSMDSLFIRGVTGVYDSDDPHQADVHGGQPVFGKMGPEYATGDAPTLNPMLTAMRNHINAETGAPTWSLAGKQRNRLFRNNGDGTFTEVGFLEGADRIEDGYVIAPADVDQDGRQDLVLRNCDPAPGVTMATVRLLKNQLAQTHSLSLSLQGVQSNRDGLGATVIAHVGDRRLVREVRATNGAVQGEPVAFFGLGDDEVIDQLEVRWPSGQRQTFDNVAQGRVRLIEGAKQLQR
jgi:hypothetical protein